MPPTRLQLQAVAMSADGALASYRPQHVGHQWSLHCGDGMVDMTQVVRMVCHPVLVKVYWYCVNYCTGGFSPGALG